MLLNRIRRWPSRLKRTRGVKALIGQGLLLVLWLLRTFRPVFGLRGRVIVTRYDHVKEVLENPRRYSVRMYGSRMRETGADFFLGIDDEDEKPERAEQRRVERDAAVAALGGGAAERAFAIATREAKEVIRRCTAPPGVRPRNCYLDVVEDLGDHVPVRVAEELFGLTNPGQRTLLEWIQLTSWYIFNPFADEADRERARVAGEQTGDHVRRLVRDARADREARTQRGDPKPDGEQTVLDRLIARGLDDGAAARTLTGLVAGSLGPPPRFFAKAVDRLLSLRGGEWEGLRTAAREGSARTVGAYLLEAARLDPDPALIYRTCEQPGAALGGRAIAPGDTVVCFMLSALRDGRRIASPQRFRLGRPERELMLFGTGPHWCIGQPVGMAVLTGMAMPLFALPGLARAAGLAGWLRDGDPLEFPDKNYPGHLGVRFDRPAGPRA